MGKWHHILFFFLLSLTFRAHAQIELKRWWNSGVIPDGHAVFCADIELTPTNELEQNLKNTGDDVNRMHLYLRIIRRYQEENNIGRASLYADSALAISTRLNDSLSICRTHVAMAYHMDLKGNPGGMMEHAKLARKTMPRSVRRTLEEFKILAINGDAYYNMYQYDDSEKAYRQAKVIVESLGNRNCMGHICVSLAKALHGNRKYDLAITEYQHAIRIFEEMGDTLTCCLLFGQIAGVYSDFGLKEKQLEYLQITLEWSEKLNDPLQQAIIYKDMGSFYKRQKDSVLTIDFYHKAAEAYLNVTDSDLMISGDKYNDLADIYQYLGDRTKSLDYQIRSMENYKSFPVPYTFATYKTGLLYFTYNQSDSAFHYFQKAYDNSLELADPRLSAICSKSLADYYYRQKNFSKAIQLAEIAYRNAREIQWMELICDISDLLSRLYARTGKYEQAYTYNTNYHQIKDSIQLKEDVREIERIAAQTKFIERETQLSMQIAAQQRKLQVQWGFTLLLTCILGLALILVIIILRNSKQRQQVNKLLNEQKEELTSYNEELTATNEELLSVNDELKKTYDELTLYKLDLEKMVNEKTAELQRAFIRVQESDRFKAAFFANMSHEIRTPLNAVVGFLQFVFKSGIPARQREQMITMINANAAQLISLVDDIVDLSKIDSGLLVIRPEYTNINEIFDEVYESAEQLIRYSGKQKLTLAMENRLPSPCEYYHIDGKRIKQVLVHLLDNAVKFTDSGYIMFGCEMADDESYLHFFVEDTGIGISPEQQAEIFKRFWKQGEIYTQSYRGVGIGLSLCEALVNMMDGAFYVDSTLGQGSVFKFSIKLIEPD